MHEQSHYDLAHYDLAIVGGGMVGASLACLLGALAPHTRIAVIEASEQGPAISEESFDARVVALSNKAVALFEQAGVWQSIQTERGKAYSGMYVWDGEGTAKVEFNAGDIRENHLGHIVENALIVQALWQKLESLPQVDLFRGAQLEELETLERTQRLTLTANGQKHTLTSELVIAADGARSQIRERMQFRVKEWDYGQSAIVTTVQTENPHRDIAWQRFTAHGPIAFLPLGKLPGKADHHYCSLVWSADNAIAAELMQYDDETFRSKLAQAFEFQLGEVLKVDTRYKIPLQQRHAESYVQPGVALVGDAAHSIHPLAGQGVNLGLYDIQVLAEEVGRAQKKNIPLHDFSILQRYERRRQSHNLLAMATMEGFKHLFASQRPDLRWLRNTGMHFFNQQSWLKNQIARLASG